MTNIFDSATVLIPSAVILVGLILALFAVHYLMNQQEPSRGGGMRFRYQLAMVGLSLLGMLGVILALPISENFRGQIISVIAILLSAALTLASTTLLGNALAGLMLQTIGHFRIGDFIRVGEHFGRVSERGLFHTEIQTEQRELTMLPNLFLVTQSVTTLRTSGTIISATVSLGYDVVHNTAEQLLIDAAKEAGLEEPFVHTLELGDFAVTYRVSGLLTDVKQCVSANSALRNRMLDSLHRGGVEIASPTLMNTRAFPTERRYVPEVTHVPATSPARSSVPEALVFDKAEEAESFEALQLRRQKVGEEIKALEQTLKAVKSPADKQPIEAQIHRLQEQEKWLATVIESQKEEREAREA